MLRLARLVFPFGVAAFVAALYSFTGWVEAGIFIGAMSGLGVWILLHPSDIE
jgi:hypothetical protein